MTYDKETQTCVLTPSFTLRGKKVSLYAIVGRMEWPEDHTDETFSNSTDAKIRRFTMDEVQFFSALQDCLSQLMFSVTKKCRIDPEIMSEPEVTELSPENNLP